VTDILGKIVNVGDVVVAPFGKDFSRKCEVVSLRPKTCLLTIVDEKGNRTDTTEIAKHYDSLVIVDSITQKLEKLGL
jgi:hypothetical protein